MSKIPELQETYATAGLVEGVQVWRIEERKLNPVPKNQIGNFFVGDSYLVLNTIQVNKQINLHFWIGSESSQDEYAAAAIISTQMDTHMRDLPIQFREIEGRESSEFNAIFAKQGGVKYKAGGVASSANHVVTNADDENRLLRVKGKPGNIKSKEVPFAWSSVFNDDVFIFEIGADIFRWKGSAASRFEFMESANVASRILYTEQNGRGSMTLLQEGDDWPKAITDALGAAPASFSTNPVADGQKEPQTSGISLYHVSNTSGKMQVKEVASDMQAAKPDMSVMDNSDCYIIDDQNSQTLFVWKGSQANVEEKRHAMGTALEFMTTKSYDPKKTAVIVLLEGQESVNFRSFFA